MGLSRLTAALAVFLALAVPSLALADSAGDNQYSDPFGNSPPTQTAPATPTAPAPTPPAASPAPAASTDPASVSAGKAASSGELPRTGLDLRAVGGIGLLLLGAGALLRRRLARS